MTLVVAAFDRVINVVGAGGLVSFRDSLVVQRHVVAKIPAPQHFAGLVVGRKRQWSSELGPRRRLFQMSFLASLHQRPGAGQCDLLLHLRLGTAPIGITSPLVRNISLGQVHTAGGRRESSERASLWL